jgi:hypothetical protein
VILVCQEQLELTATITKLQKVEGGLLNGTVRLTVLDRGTVC